ncbi:branched-chain amino acid aminotransferase II [Pluteus cervinus]|uniref:Branched-chain amino acid aminotransferase II n=1 Tax=Pluteus cervinus TaxID=181527 RepID=A0ACD3A483_9AGAR|nr:branched-chain amino acid aminotransferase II [Pluteus cervinus]
MPATITRREQNKTAITGIPKELAVKAGSRLEPAPLDPEQVIIDLTPSPKTLPSLENFGFGENKTDHMLVCTYDSITGWAAPEIKPYGPLSLDPASSCLQYATSVFEGMKAYLGPDGEIRLFRPELNMQRLANSAARVALPQFDQDALLTLIKRLVTVDARWIPAAPGYSLYLRPTMIGTRSAFGVTPSDSAILYVVCAPAGPYFRSGVKPISLLAGGEGVRAWPGGTGGHKVASNYSPGFVPQIAAAKQGYDQILWLFGDDRRVTEAGAMNFFIVVKREDDENEIDIITPPLDGTILPGITRSSCISLLQSHSTDELTLSHIPSSHRIHVHERILTMPEIAKWYSQGRVLEAFTVGTGVVVAPVGKIGFEGLEIVFPKYVENGGFGPVTKGIMERLLDIQFGRREWKGWSVRCD